LVRRTERYLPIVGGELAPLPPVGAVLNKDADQRFAADTNHSFRSVL